MGISPAERSSTKRPPIPVLPVLGGRDLLPRKKSTVASVLDVGDPIFLSSGSEAIRGALIHAGVGVGDDVLVPAFNCPAMVTPIDSVGATAVFFGITEDLRIDTAAVEPRLGPRARALIAPHLFGRVQDLRDIRALCDARGLRLIEDCAHALFGDGRPMVGATGDYAIASPRKFLPLAEGGLLTSRVHDLRGLRMERATAFQAVRTAFDTLDIAVAHGRLPAMTPFISSAKALQRTLAARTRPRSPGPPVLARAAKQPLAAAAWVTRGLVRHLMTEDLLARRRANFRFLRAALAGMTAVKLVTDEPPNDPSFVPYMLPVLLSRPRQQFARLKQSGVPIWRWEHSHLGACRVTDWYAEALVQIPCHQSLGPDELTYIVDAVRSSADG